MSIIRSYHGECREKNIAFLESTFRKAFEIIEKALQEREDLCKKKDSKTREEMLEILRNCQLIKRLKHKIQTAKEKMKSLMTTYESDVNTIARLKLLQDRVDDQLEQISESIKYLDKIEKTSNSVDNISSPAKNFPGDKVNSGTVIAKNK